MTFAPDMMPDATSSRPTAAPTRKGTGWTGVAALVGMSLALGGCQLGILHPRGPVAEAQKTILIGSLLTMLAIVVPTILATLLFAWWFRASNPRARRLPDFAYSGRVELVTWSIPLLVVLFLGGVAWVGSHELDPMKPVGSGKPLRVEVVSLDWKWLFILPEEHVASVNELVVPVGRPLAFRLTSASVMNAFFVPQLGSMIYTMNGMETRLHLQADHEGEFAGLSSHFSGDGFSGMRFKLRAVSPDAFGAWVAEAGRSTAALDRSAFEALAKPSTAVPSATFRDADGGLFDAIVSQAIPPAPGPPAANAALATDPLFDTAAAICTPAMPFGDAAAPAVPPRRS